MAGPDDPRLGSDRETVEALYVDEPGVASRQACALETARDELAVRPRTSLEDALDDLDGAEVVACTSDLPGEDGLELVEAIRERRPGLPLVFLTPNGPERVASEAVSAGVTAYLSERPDPEELAGILLSVVDAHDGSERYHSLIDASPAPILLFDADGEVVYANDAAAELLAADDPTDLRGRDALGFVHPDQRERAAERLERVIEEREAVPTIDMRLVDLEGRERYVRIATAPGTYRGKRIGQAILTDVTELERTRRDLQAEKSFVEEALDALDDLFFVVQDGELTRWNERLPDVTGYSESEIGSMNAADFFTGADAERIESAIETARESGHATVEADLVTRDGETIPHEFRGVRLTDADGEPIGVCGIGRDVTERERYESELEERRRRLQVLNRTNAILRDVNRDIVRATDREEIERAACERFVEHDPFVFAWLGEYDRVRERLEPRTWAGEERGYLDTLEIATDEGARSRGPGGRAVETGEVQVVDDVRTDPDFEPWRAAALDRGYESVAVVPLVTDGFTYGVFAIYADRVDAFAEVETDVLAEFGETLAYAISAVARKEALLADTTTELEFEVGDTRAFFARLSGELACELELERLDPTPGGYRLTIAVSESMSEEMLDRIGRFASVESVDPVDGDREESLLELETTDDLVADVLASRGALTRAITATEGVQRVVAELPASIDPRGAVEAVEGAYEDVELLAKREPVEGSEIARALTISDALTDRQREVLESAYRRGYFETPREVTGVDLAADLGISQPTFTRHLRAAQRNLLRELFDL